MKIKIEITEIKVKIQKIEKKPHPNFLAYASVTFRLKDGGCFTISNFTIWKSKYDGRYNVEPPKNNRKFQYCFFKGFLWEMIEREVINKYEYEEIPIINEKN